MIRKLLAFVALVLVLAVVIAYFKELWWWFEVHSGTVNESGPYYGFWSGFGSDLGEASLLGAVLVGYRHHNCHVMNCIRLGKPVEGTPYIACPKHHPDHKGDKRGVSVEDIHEHFHRRVAERAA